jgi:hypothetical protein
MTVRRDQVSVAKKGDYMRSKSLLVAFLLLILSVPFLAQNENKKSRDVGKVASVSSAGSDSEYDKIKRTLIAREHQLWKAMGRKDVESLNRLVADDARFADGNKAISKAAFAQYISSYSPSDYSLTDLKVHLIDGRSGIVSYKVTAKFFFNEEVELPVSAALVRSVWVNKSHQWQLSQHHVSLMPSARVRL